MNYAEDVGAVDAEALEGPVVDPVLELALLPDWSLDDDLSVERDDISGGATHLLILSPNRPFLLWYCLR